MEFYHEIITQKSFVSLQELKGRHNFILIGGWAIFLYTRALKSKDIDIIVDYPELAKLKESQNVFKNDRLKKYEIKTGEFDIDIYLEHYSDLGIGIGAVKSGAVVKEGFSVPRMEILLLLKLYAWENRRGSAKGQKDELDIFALASLPEFNWKNYKNAVEDNAFEKYNRLFEELIKKTREVKGLGINQQKMARLRKNILNQLG
jgi:acyl-CoA-binding protein